MIETGCAQGSSVGKIQCLTYWSSVEKEPNNDRSRTKMRNFESVSEIMQGVAKVWFPSENMWFSLKIRIGTAGMPVLLSIAKMDRIGAYLNNSRDELVQKESQLAAKIARVNVFLLSIGCSPIVPFKIANSKTSTSFFLVTCMQIN